MRIHTCVQTNVRKLIKRFMNIYEAVQFRTQEPQKVNVRNISLPGVVVL